jgi:hypothetical protein
VALERADRIGGWHPLWDLLTRIHGLALPPSALDEIQSAMAIGSEGDCPSCTATR